MIYIQALYKNCESFKLFTQNGGVGAREIGYMFGQYKRIRNEFTGVLTGKGINWGGSLIRPEATGYGVVYFTQKMLEHQGEGFKGKKVVISGSGNVAQYAAEKVIQLGGTVLTLSDSSGYIYDKSGIDEEKLSHIKTPITLSIIGCVVNGPGEASMTDIGITGGGKGSNMLYLSGIQLEKVPTKNIISKVVSEVEKKYNKLKRFDF